MYLIFPPPCTHTSSNTPIFIYFHFLDILFMRMLNIYIFFVFNCLHLLSGFFCSFNWNVYFTLILVNISPKPYRSTVCDCGFVCVFLLRYEANVCTVIRWTLSLEKATDADEKVKKRKWNYGKQNFFLG